MQNQLAKLHSGERPERARQAHAEHIQTVKETMKTMHDFKSMMAGMMQNRKRMDMMRMMEHQSTMQHTGK